MACQAANPLGKTGEKLEKRLFRAPGAAEVVSESFCLPAEPFKLVTPFSFAHLDPLPRTAHWDGASTHCSLRPPSSSDLERVPRITGVYFSRSLRPHLVLAAPPQSS